MAIDLIFSVVVLIFSVVIHEVSHGWMAYYLGDPTAKLAGRLTLNPLKHLDPIGSILIPLLTYSSGGFIFGWAKPVPYNPYNLQAGRSGPAYVAAAGPAANLLIALIFSGVIRFAATSGAALTLPPTLIQISALIVFLNLILAIFNLLPVPPLDGSKILFALLPPQQRAVEDWLNRYQFILILFVLFFLWSFISPLVTFLFRLFTGLAL
ncbi:MAG: site-2 protease family protein [Patescibacteria group bacterium]